MISTEVKAVVVAAIMVGSVLAGTVTAVATTQTVDGMEGDERPATGIAVQSDTTGTNETRSYDEFDVNGRTINVTFAVEDYESLDNFPLTSDLIQREESMRLTESSNGGEAVLISESNAGVIATHAFIETTPRDYDPATATNESSFVAENGTHTVEVNYTLDGSATQKRETGTLRNSVTAVETMTEVIVYDETTDERVTSETVRVYKVETPDWTVLRNDAIFSYLTAFLNFYTDELANELVDISEVPAVGEETFADLAGVNVTKDESGYYNSTGPLNVTFEAEEGHEYTVAHKSYGSAVAVGYGKPGLAGLGFNVSTQNITVREGGEAPPERAVAHVIASREEGHDPLLLSLREIRSALVWWATGETVPGTGGETLDLETMRDLLVRWALGQQVT